MLGEGGSYSGKDDLFFILNNCLPDKAATRNAFLFYRRRGDRLMGDLTYIMKSRLAASSGGVVVGEVNTWVRRRPGYEAPGRRTSRAFLGRLAFRPSPFGALGLGRLAR